MTQSKIIFTVGGFLSFFVFGFVDNLKGPLLPELLRSGEMSYSQAGTILLAGYVGFLVSTLVTGFLADVIENRLVLLWAGVSLCVGCIGFGATPLYAGMLFFMLLIGLGLGAIELGANALFVELHSANRATFLNLLGTFHGVGSLLVPLYAACLLSLSVSWQLIYGSCILLSLPLVVIFSRGSKPPSSEALQSADSRSLENSHAVRKKRVLTGNWRKLLQEAFTSEMWAYYFLLTTYVASELGLATWLVEFLQHERKQSVTLSSVYLSGFFVLLMLGRLVGAFYVESIGYLKAIAIALFGSCICLAVGVFGDQRMIFLLPFSGLFMSIVFPTIAASVSKLHPENTGAVFGILFSFAGLGGALGPFVIGCLSDIWGLQIGLASTVGFSAAALIALGVLKLRASMIESCQAGNGEG